MSGSGTPDLRIDGAEGLTVTVVADRWHEQVMDGLVAGAERALADAAVSARVVRVPGAFELPLAAQAAARAGADAVVALGVVIRGGTPHFDYVCAAASGALAQVALETGVPIGFGLLTCDDDAQALDRAGLAGSREDKGYEAAQAAVAMALALRTLNSVGAPAINRLSP